jgi:hypothetical protein
MSNIPDNLHIPPPNGRHNATASHVNGSHNGNAHKHSLHRIGLVRRRQGVSLRTVSRHWNVELAEVRRQQQSSTDMSLSQLYRWQQVLGVPIAELLVDDQQGLSNPILERAQLVKIMKTAVTMKEMAREPRIQRLVATILSQLTELMPELADVGPWHGSGNRRTLDDFGRAVDYRLSEEVLYR